MCFLLAVAIDELNDACNIKDPEHVTGATVRKLKPPPHVSKFCG